MDPGTFFKDHFLNKELSDVRIIVENKKGRTNFPAHSLVLKWRSPVIAKMLESDFVEGQTQTIVITDFKANHIEMFLRFLYTNILPESYTGLCKLIKIADKYFVSTLTEKCVESLLGFVNLQNVYELCNLSETYSLEKLRDRCVFLIKRAAFNLLLNSDDVKGLSKEMMMDIVRADDLNFSKEIDVFWAILQWGNLQLGYQRKALNTNEIVKEFIDDLIKYVRWSLTAADEREKIANLGITVDDVDFQIPRNPSTVDIQWFLNQCDILRVDQNIPFFVRLTGMDYDGILMTAMSLSNSPFYVVGVLFACMKKPDKTNLKFSCGSTISIAQVPAQVEKHLTIESTGMLQYQEIMYEFLNPIEVFKNQILKINLENHTQSGCVLRECPGTGEIISCDRGRELYIFGTVYGIRKVFLL